MTDLERAHRHSSRHRAEILRSAMCGCFCCLAVFPPSALAWFHWVDDDQTATCPRCSIDSVIGDASGFPIDREFLARMEVRWFDLLRTR